MMRRRDLLINTGVVALALLVIAAISLSRSEIWISYTVAWIVAVLIFYFYMSARGRDARLARRHTAAVRGGPALAPGAALPAPGSRAARKAGLLHPDATVTLAAERAAAGIDGIFESLDAELVGLVPVKQKIEEIAALLLVDRLRHRFGLDAPRPNLHMCFTGPPGTGKTTVALRMADLLFRLGYLEKGHLVHAIRD